MPKIGDVIPIKSELILVLENIDQERKDSYEALTKAQNLVSEKELKFFKTVYDGMPEFKGCTFIYDRELSRMTVTSTNDAELTKAVEG